jgi:hypothetical protein
LHVTIAALNDKGLGVVPRLFPKDVQLKLTVARRLGGDR